MKVKKKKPERRNRTLEFIKTSQEITRATTRGWVGYFDGACDPNPGPMGVGALLQCDNLPVDAVAQKSGHGTNNVAEYLALIALLKMADKHSAHDVLICGDSMLVLMQVGGHWKVKAPHLQAYRDEARILARKIIGGVRWAWIPREHNELADALSKQ